MPTFLDALLKQRMEDWIFTPIASPRGAEHAAEVIPAEHAYVSVFLRSARIVNVRSGLTRFYGVVHSLIRVHHRSGNDIEFATVAVPSLMKDLDPKRLDRVVQMNHRMLGPVPYVGGDLKLEVGLLSVPAADLAAPYTQLLERISERAGVAYVAHALSYASLITDGINLLAGAGDKSILEIGLSIQQDEPKAGWYAAIRAPKGSLDVEALRIDPRDQKLVTDNGAALQNHPYLVIEVKQEPERQDWFKIPDLAQAYAAIQAEFRKGDAAATREAISTFRRAAFTSNDLLSDDAVKLSEKLLRRFAELGSPVPPHQRERGDAPAFPSLESLDLYGGR